MPRWFYALLVLAPIALAAQLLGAAPPVVFGLSTLSLVPLAGLIGKATEELAHHFGPRLGGLLNATFGNAAELIITIAAIHDGLLTLVKASITGSIIGNTLLVLGASLFVGGLKHRRQQSYDPRDASMNAAMMILAIAALYLPAVFGDTVHESLIIEEVSLLVAAVLLLVYGAYLIYTLATAPESSDLLPEDEPAIPNWSIQRSLVVLAAATAGAAVAAELLVSTIEPVTKQFGWSEFFVGVIIIPIVGNAAEHFSAVQMAWRDRLDVTLGIAAGSSTQIALLVAPLLVFISLLMGHPMNLIFHPLELTLLGLSTAIFAYISIDGKSNWLEGVQLMAIYLIAGFVFFFLPLAEH